MAKPKQKTKAGRATATAKKPAAKKPSVKKPAAKKPAAKPAAAKRPAAVKQATGRGAPTVLARKPSADRLAQKAQPAAPIYLPPVLRAPPPTRPVPTRAVVTRPLPPPVRTAPPPPVRVLPPAPTKELDAERPVARLLQHGEVMGKHRLETRHLPTPLALPTGRVALGDALSPDLRVLERRLPPGRYRLMVSVAGDGAEQRLAAIVMYCGRPPIARWVHAHLEGKRPPKAAADAPTFAASTFGLCDASAIDRVKPTLRDATAPGRVALDAALAPIGVGWAHAWHVFDDATGLALAAFASSKGPRTHAAYWGLDPAGQPVCLVIDAGLLAAGDWKQARARR
ncbi:MAG: DUF4241 domain-containing protein [Kofleriaceae bacterium]